MGSQSRTRLSDFTLLFITRHIYNWGSFITWHSLFILSGEINNCPLLFPNSMLDTLRPRGHHLVSYLFAFSNWSCSFVSRILVRVAISSSSGPRFVRTLHYDPNVLRGPVQYRLYIPWVMGSLSWPLEQGYISLCSWIEFPWWLVTLSNFHIHVDHLYVFFFFWSVCIQVLFPLFKQIDFLLFSCMSFLYILGINPLLNILFVNIFFHCVVAFSFCWLILLLCGVFFFFFFFFFF